MENDKLNLEQKVFYTALLKAYAELSGIKIDKDEDLEFKNIDVDKIYDWSESMPVHDLIEEVSIKLSEKFSLLPIV